MAIVVGGNCSHQWPPQAPPHYRRQQLFLSTAAARSSKLERDFFSLLFSHSLPLLLFEHTCCGGGPLRCTVFRTGSQFQTAKKKRTRGMEIAGEKRAFPSCCAVVGCPSSRFRPIPLPPSPPVHLSSISRPIQVTTINLSFPFFFLLPIRPSARCFRRQEKCWTEKPRFLSCREASSS